VDCGNGVFGKLRERIDHREVDAVVISHHHGDHILDLVPYSYALTYGQSREAGKPVLHLPPGAAQALRTIAGAFDKETLVEDAFEVVTYDPASPIVIGDLQIDLREVPHFTPAFAMAFSSGASGRFVYGADCARSDALVELATGADVLMVEAALPAAYDGPADAKEGHLGPEEAGEMAREAGVGRLVLTHATDQMDLEESRSVAEVIFGGPVEMAREGSSWQL
jgi:ribonuclease BN (tRNA processing enzyme)